MADNIAVTPGSGATVATEDVSGVHHQKVKIEFGADGVATMVDGDNPLPTLVDSAPDNRESWRIETKTETNANDSDKTFTVDADEEWQILGLHVTYAATSTAGNRQLVVEWSEATAANLIGQVRAGLVQAESTTYYYMIAPGLAPAAAVVDSDFVTVALPPVKLTAGQKIRVYDNNAVAAAADDMTIRMQIASRSIA